MANRLALAIPAYGRAGAVAENLAYLAEDANRLGVDLYYSDDSPDDSVEVVVREYAKTFDNIHYHRNDPPLGHDRNIVRSLTWPKADYVWLLGDVWRPKLGGVDRILDFIHNQDMIFLNRKSDDDLNQGDVTGEAVNAIVRDKLWNQTLTGATIYHRRVRDWILHTSPEIKRNFPQLSIILGYSLDQNPSIGWFSVNILETAHKTGSYWHTKALDVFIGDWADVVKSYPMIIPDDLVKSIIRSHSENTHVFNGEFLLGLRKNRQFKWSSLRRVHFWDAMHLHPVQVLTVLLLSPFAARSVLALKRIYKNMLIRGEGTKC